MLKKEIYVAFLSVGTNYLTKLFSTPSISPHY